MLLSIGSTAYATDLESGSTVISDKTSSSMDITGESVLTDDEIEEYYASLSKYDLDKIAEKKASALNYEKNSTKSGTKISIPGTFTMYQQETDSYCIPATIKSILMYINGTSPSQTTISSTTGQDPTTIASYLNDRQSTCYYIYVPKSNLTQDTMCNYFYYTIAYTQVPASIGISGTTTSNWYYVTNGHSMVVNAIYDDYSYVQFGDPLGDRVAGCPYFYTKTSNLTYSVCTRIVY